MANSTMTRDGEAWGVSVSISLCCVVRRQRLQREMALIKELVDKMLLGRGLLLPPQAHHGASKADGMTECSHPAGFQR